jgi:hypothetical protein
MILTIFLILVWVILATYGDVNFKAAYGSLTNRAFFSGVICYLACAPLAAIVFHRQTWGWIIILWNSCSLLLSIALSCSIYHEPLTMKRITATSLVLIAMLLAE